jgi:hypothetical protein
MNDTAGGYQRWRAADESGRDDDADVALRSLFQTVVPEPSVSAGFTARTMAAVADVAARDARRARRTRAAVVSSAVVGGLAAAYFGTGLAISIVSSMFLGLFDLLIAGTVRGASAVETGAGFWAVLASLGRAAAAFAADPKVTIAIVVVQGIAIAALVALQRLLGSDRESFE